MDLFIAALMRANQQAVFEASAPVTHSARSAANTIISAPIQTTVRSLCSRTIPMAAGNGTLSMLVIVLVSIALGEYFTLMITLLTLMQGGSLLC